jgi:isopentenyl-diphosphate Delta-isomerase
LVIHLNALQEALQPEGTPQFQGALEALSSIFSELSVPLVLKETGCGFSRQTLGRIAERFSLSFGKAELAALDVSGLGGTHWGRIEGARSPKQSVFQEAAETFANWGIPTVDAVLNATEALRGKKTEIWASGGVRTGLDAAKLIALGAHRVGFAQPVLEHALKGEDALNAWMEVREYELRVALFCTGSSSVSKLRLKEDVWKIG